MEIHPGPVHTTPETFKPFWIGVRERLEQGKHVIIVTSLFSKIFCSKLFPSTLERKAGILKFLQFEERFQKLKALRFRGELVWTVGLTLEIKLRRIVCVCVGGGGGNCVGGGICVVAELGTFGAVERFFFFFFSFQESFYTSQISRYHFIFLA